MSDKDVIICGSPKSGNTWIARLIGDALNSPVTGWQNAVPIAQEGLNRKGGYTVRQLHLRPVSGQKDQPFILSAREANTFGWNGEKVVWIHRDPRDVAVAAKHYWEIESIQKTILAMAYGEHPFGPFGSWSSFNEDWLAMTRSVYYPIYEVSFAEFVVDQGYALFRLLNRMDLADYYSDEIHDAYERQRIANKRKQIESEDEKLRSYNKGVQLKNLRAGRIGDWKSEFSQDDKILANFHFKQTAMRIGYHYDWE